MEELLQELGITRRYKGRAYVIFALELLEQDETRQMKDIYLRTARRFHRTISAVERNLRTVVKRAWQVNPQLVRRLAGRPLLEAPTVSEFLDILYNSLQRSPR